MERARRGDTAGNPAAGVDRNLAGQGAAERKRLTAYDLRHELQGMLGWSDDELRALPIYSCDEIIAGEVYLDLGHLGPSEFRATDKTAAHPSCRFVPKRAVPEDLWYRLATSIGQEPRPAGNAAPKPGAFGGSETEEPPATPEE